MFSLNSTLTPLVPFWTKPLPSSYHKVYFSGRDRIPSTNIAIELDIKSALYSEVEPLPVYLNNLVISVEPPEPPPPELAKTQFLVANSSPALKTLPVTYKSPLRYPLTAVILPSITISSAKFTLPSSAPIVPFTIKFSAIETEPKKLVV